MTDRERMLEILNVPIFPHERVDPLEAVADYLLDNDVRPVVRCKDCKKWFRHTEVDRERGECRRYQTTKHESGYCDRGERKDNG